jgi:hypothetical protein
MSLWLSVDQFGAEVKKFLKFSAFKSDIPKSISYIQRLLKGKPSEKQGRKASGLRPRGWIR